MKPAHLIVFAKFPRPGFAKTRLIPALGPAGASGLAHRLILNTVMVARTSSIATTEFCVTPLSSEDDWRALGVPGAMELTDQGEGDLGTRMSNACHRAVGRGTAAILIGTDCPSLTAGHINAAVAALESTDCVLIPAIDGGYVLLGTNRHVPDLFNNIPWGTDRVAAITLNRIEALSLDVTIFDPLQDIDVPADLDHLPPALPARC